MPYPFINMSAGGTIGLCGGVEPPTEYCTLETGEKRRSMLFDEIHKAYMSRPQQDGDDETFTLFFSVKRSGSPDTRVETLIGPTAYSSTDYKNGVTLYNASGYTTPLINFMYRRKRDKHQWLHNSRRTLKDTNGWYSFVITIKSDATCTMWCNGELVDLDTTFAGYKPGGNQDAWFTTEGDSKLYIGHNPSRSGASTPAKCQMTMIGIHEGVAHTDITDFGGFDENTGQWVPKDPDTDGWQGNSFYLSGKEEIVRDGVDWQARVDKKPFDVALPGPKPLGMVFERPRTTGVMQFHSPLMGNGIYVSGAGFVHDNGHNTFPTSRTMSFVNGVSTDNTFVGAIGNVPAEGVEFIRYAGGEINRYIPHNLGKKPVAAMVMTFNTTGPTTEWLMLDATQPRNHVMYARDGDPTYQRSAVFGFHGCTDKLFHIPAKNAYAGQSLPGDSPKRWESFVVDGVTYLLDANNSKGLDWGIDSYMYRLDHATEQLVKIQTLPGQGRYGYTTFVTNGKTYVVAADSGLGTPANTQKFKVYRFNKTTKKLDVIQEITREMTNGVDTFTHSGIVYLVTSNGNSHSGGMFTFNAQTEQFTMVQDNLSASYGMHVKEFSVSGVQYVMYADTGNSANRHHVSGVVYKFNPTTKQLSVLQRIPMAGAYHFETFEVNGTLYGWASNRYAASAGSSASSVQLSTLYRWDTLTERFYDIQSLPTEGGTYAEAFVENGDTYLLIACSRNDTSNQVYSLLMRFNPEKEGLEVAQRVLTHGNECFHSFVTDGKRYAVTAESSNPAGSQLLQWQAGTGCFHGSSTMTEMSINETGMEYLIMLVADTSNSQMSHACGSPIARMAGYSTVSWISKGRQYFIIAQPKAYSSTVYRWDATTNTPIAVQHINTPTVGYWKAVYFGDKVYLLCPDGNMSSSLYDPDTKIYEFNDLTEEIDLIQSIDKAYGKVVAGWTAGGHNFIASGRGNTYNGSTQASGGQIEIYRQDPVTRLSTVVKTATIEGLSDIVPFERNGKQYLMASAYAGSPGYTYANAVSRLYEFNPATYDLVQKQTFAVAGSTGAAHFTAANGKAYVLLASQYNGTVFIQDSRLYVFNDTTGFLEQKDTFQVYGIRRIKTFKSKGRDYIVATTSSDPAHPSKVFRFEPESETLTLMQELGGESTEDISIFDWKGDVHMVQVYQKQTNSRTLKWLPNSERFSSSMDTDIRADLGFKRSSHTSTGIYVEYDFRYDSNRALSMASNYPETVRSIRGGATISHRNGYVKNVEAYDKPWGETNSIVLQKNTSVSSYTSNPYREMSGIMLGSSKFMGGMTNDVACNNSFDMHNGVETPTRKVIMKDSPFNNKVGFVESYSVTEYPLHNRTQGSMVFETNSSETLTYGKILGIQEKLYKGHCFQYRYLKSSVNNPGMIVYFNDKATWKSSSLALHAAHGKYGLAGANNTAALTSLTTALHYTVVVTVARTDDNYIEVYHDDARVIRTLWEGSDNPITLSMNLFQHNMAVELETDYNEMIFPPASVSKGMLPSDQVSNYRIIDPRKFHAAGTVPLSGYLSVTYNTISDMDFKPDIIIARPDVSGQPAILWSSIVDYGIHTSGSIDVPANVTRLTTAGTTVINSGSDSYPQITGGSFGFYFSGGANNRGIPQSSQGRPLKYMAFKASTCSGIEQQIYEGDFATNRTITHNLEGKPEVVWIIDVSPSSMSNSQYPTMWAEAFQGDNYYARLSHPDAPTFIQGSFGHTVTRRANNISIGKDFNRAGHTYLMIAFKSVPGFSAYFQANNGYTPHTPQEVSLGFRPGAMIRKMVNGSHWDFFGSVFNTTKDVASLSGRWASSSTGPMYNTEDSYATANGYVLKDTMNSPSMASQAVMAWALSPAGLSSAV